MSTSRNILVGISTVTVIIASSYFIYTFFIQDKKVDKASSTSKEENKKKVNMSNNKNTAYVFIKPHANNTKTQELVSSTLINKSITILKEGEFTGEQIDAGMLIDQHYYAIASKATILKPEQIPVPVDKFQDKFGLSWETALTDKLVFNAMDACTELGVDAVGLDQIWSKSDKVKFGGGFYCGKLIPDNHTPIYVFNAFFMEMRSKFVTPGTSIHYYVVEFDPSVLSWSDFRGVVLGPTDPAKAPEGSLRNMLFLEWSAYGLASEPNTGDNCVHASASPFEGLAERLNWLKVDPAEDSFGKLALNAGISAETLKEWSVDPVVKGKSIFDQLEDMDVDACLAKMVELAK